MSAVEKVERRMIRKFATSAAIVICLCAGPAKAEMIRGWFVIVGSVKGTTASIVKRAHGTALEELVRRCSLDTPWMLESDAMRGLGRDFQLWLLGPYGNRRKADQIATRLRRCVPDARVVFTAYDADY
jgi:hypothetical protein